MDEKEVNALGKNEAANLIERLNEQEKEGNINREDKYFLLCLISSLLDEESQKYI